MSVLLPETQRILREAAHVKQNKRAPAGESPGAVLQGYREWLASRPHTSWCSCVVCKSRRELAEAGRLSEQLREQLARQGE